MGEDAVETFFADVTGSDIGMTIEVGIERTFGIVGMDDFYAVETECLLGRGYCPGESRGSGDVIA